MSEPLPLVIGVTGHRDLIPDELPLIEEKVREFFVGMQARFQGFPLTILNPTAEGADQLVARVALELDIPVLALLPMPLDIYRQDFEGDALERFNDLLAQCETVELPLLESPVNRDAQYIELAGYLAAHSHILMAIWDGMESHLPGGTSAVVRFHQHDTMSQLNDDRPLNPIDFIEDESDLVFHISCSRKSRAGSHFAGETSWLTRDDVTPRTPELPPRYDVVLNRMIEFNRDAIMVDDRKLQLLIEEHELGTAPAGVIEIAHLFGIADSLASHFQYLMFSALRTGYALVLLAGLSFIIYADIFSSDYMIYSYLACMALVIFVFQFENYHGWQRKYLDYRVLAEALRVQFYWSLAGVRMDQRHKFAHDSFHERRELQLGWIRNVMRYAARRVDTQLDLVAPETIDLVISSWIADEQVGQSGYYRRKSIERAKRNRMTQILEVASLGVVIVVALLLVFSSPAPALSDLLIAFVGFLPIIAAVRQNYAHRTAEKELVSQYQYFHRIFSNAEQLIHRTDNYETKREILRALGNAALDESSQWILRQRERPTGSGPVIG
jgi:hypothetical protein